MCAPRVRELEGGGVESCIDIQVLYSLLTSGRSFNDSIGYLFRFITVLTKVHDAEIFLCSASNNKKKNNVQLQEYIALPYLTLISYSAQQG